MKAHNDKALRQRYSVCLMSNHKWKKFFVTMAEYGADFSGIEYHFTDTEKVFFGNAPSNQQVWDSAIDDPVKGCGGPVEYKHIERIFIPRTYSYQPYENAPTTYRDLNLERFLVELCKVGEFPIVRTEKGIDILGYET
ncbi:hypothetical protein [Vibrio parahaemolyticus]|uniref:hypothetical protein n=1 Tax=Vibrio parahaemolyticus TaxID=670 RepID=UPI00084A6BF0|nr:hypothetical protein [Vibrio parahaemolyticus]MBM5010013.1 hypothetical protein [Vibrio parahaemolyticus]ODY13044.1 hypothetical protein BBM17_16990 [Vibrio parahaemolyticus]HCG8482064.1 hypothetical protein [Vibrio parahaemolyticus]